jgi:hypothetical protein
MTRENLIVTRVGVKDGLGGSILAVRRYGRSGRPYRDETQSCP